MTGGKLTVTNQDTALIRKVYANRKTQTIKYEMYRWCERDTTGEEKGWVDKTSIIKNKDDFYRALQIIFEANLKSEDGQSCSAELFLML